MNGLAVATGSDEDLLFLAGFDTHSAGPTRPRCAAIMGAWQYPMRDGFPYRWDLVLADCRQAFPERFSPNIRHEPRPTE